MSERRQKGKERSREDTWKSGELKQYVGKKQDTTKVERHKPTPDPKTKSSELKQKEALSKEKYSSAAKPKISSEQAKPRQSEDARKPHDARKKSEQLKPPETKKQRDSVRKETKHRVERGRAHEGVKLKSDSKTKISTSKTNLNETPKTEKVKTQEIFEDIPDPVVPPVTLKATQLQESSDVDDVASYAEDFESYDEDFEEATETDKSESDSDPGYEYDLDSIKRAIEDENVRVEQKLQTRNITPQPEETTELTRKDEMTNFEISGKGFISFEMPKTELQPSKEENMKRTRLKNLMALIELDSVSVDLFEIPPISEYDVYIKQFGTGMRGQIGIQTYRDTFDCDTQTDTIVSRDKWIQHSIDTGVCICGGTIEDTSNIFDYFSIGTNLMQENVSDFFEFFSKTSQVMCVILEENIQNISRNVSQVSTEPLLSFTLPNSIHFKSIPILDGRKIVSTSVSSIQSNSILLAYAPLLLDEHPLDTISMKGMLAYWNLNDPYQPRRLMECESTPTCCCFSPDRLTLAIAGCDNGAVAIWDFRDTFDTLTPLRDHQNVHTYQPSYCTAMFSNQGSHYAPICAIDTIYRSGDKTPDTLIGDTRGDSEILSGLSFQIATADVQGVVNIWVVAQISEVDICGSLSDLCLTPGSRVKLIRTISISLITPSKISSKIKSTLSLTYLKFHPTDLNHYYAGTEDGLVIHGARNVSRPTPRSFKVKYQLMPVTSLDFHPIKTDYFVVSYKVGTFAIFNRKIADPILVMESEDFVSLKRVKWSRVHPSVLYTLSENGELSYWDLLTDYMTCVKKEKVSANSIEIVDFDLTLERSGFKDGEIVLVFSDGSCQVHPLRHSSSSQGVSSELDRFTEFLDSCDLFA